MFVSSVVLQLPQGPDGPQPDWEEGLTVWRKLKLLKGQTLGYFRERRQYSDPKSRQVPAGLCSGLNWKPQGTGKGLHVLAYLLESPFGYLLFSEYEV